MFRICAGQDLEREAVRHAAESTQISAQLRSSQERVIALQDERSQRSTPQVSNALLFFCIDYLQPAQTTIAALHAQTISILLQQGIRFELAICICHFAACIGTGIN